MFPSGLPSEDAGAWGASLVPQHATFDSVPFPSNSSFVPVASAPILSAPLGFEFSDMVAAMAAAEHEKSKPEAVTPSEPFSRGNSDAFSENSASVGSSDGQSKSAHNSLQSMSDMFADSSSHKSSPATSKVGGKATDEKEWSDDDEDDQPKKKKFVIKIKDTASQSATVNSAAVVPTLSLSMPAVGLGAPAAPSGTRRRGSAAVDAVPLPPSPGFGSGAFGGAFGGAFSSPPSSTSSDPFASSASDSFASGTADPFASQMSLSERVNARVTQTVNAKFGPGTRRAPTLLCVPPILLFRWHSICNFWRGRLQREGRSYRDSQF